MFEQFTRELSPQEVGAYLQRIGMVRQEPSLEYLDQLIEAHQKTVPFENLEVHDQCKNVSLAVGDLFDKIVTRRRGGFCFEMNGLFVKLLQALGFDAYSIEVRSVFDGEVSFSLHRAQIVRLEGTPYLVDVGFGGPQPSFALEVADGATGTGCGQTFEIREAGEGWWSLVYHGSQGPSEVWQFNLVAQDPTMYIVPSFYCCVDEHSFFRTGRMVNLRTDTGSVAYTNGELTVFEGGERTVTQIDPAQDAQVLREHFGIVL